MINLILFSCFGFLYSSSDIASPGIPYSHRPLSAFDVNIQVFQDLGGDIRKTVLKFTIKGKLSQTLTALHSSILAVVMGKIPGMCSIAAHF